MLVIDETAIFKKSTHSVGVAVQYASTLGKAANCQTLVSLTLARRSPCHAGVAAVSSGELDEQSSAP
jgi:SRSO17 transposase